MKTGQDVFKSSVTADSSRSFGEGHWLLRWIHFGKSQGVQSIENNLDNIVIIVQPVIILCNMPISYEYDSR